MYWNHPTGWFKSTIGLEPTTFWSWGSPIINYSATFLYDAKNDFKNQELHDLHSKITMAGDVVPYYTVIALVPTLK